MSVTIKAFNNSILYSLAACGLPFASSLWITKDVYIYYLIFLTSSVSVKYFELFEDVRHL